MSSELITLILSIVQGRIWWGSVSRETLIIGSVDALVVPLIVASVVIYFVKQTAEMQRVNGKGSTFSFTLPVPAVKGEPPSYP